MYRFYTASESETRVSWMLSSLPTNLGYVWQNAVEGVRGSPVIHQHVWKHRDWCVPNVRYADAGKYLGKKGYYKKNDRRGSHRKAEITGWELRAVAMNGIGEKNVLDLS